MTELEKRCIERRNRNIQIKKVDLHDEVEHNSFHHGLNMTDAWNLLYTMSIQKWESETGKKATHKVDKSRVKIISLHERYE